MVVRRHTNCRDIARGKNKVPEWTWTDDKACLADRSGDEQFGDFQCFSADGIKLNGIQTPVFVLKDKFNALQKGKFKLSKNEQPEANRRAGRPKGSGIDDEQWLDEIEKLVLDGMSPFTAAIEVVAKFDKRIERKPTTKIGHVSDRLYKKYGTSGRPKKSHAN